LAQRARKLLPFHEREKNDTNKMKLWQEIRKMQHITNYSKITANALSLLERKKEEKKI
jgi:hypothetical protein